MGERRAMWRRQHEAPAGACRGVSSMGGAAPHPCGRAGASVAAQAEVRDELFSLESSGPPSFAALIRLTPDRSAVAVFDPSPPSAAPPGAPLAHVAVDLCDPAPLTRALDGIAI